MKHLSIAKHIFSRLSADEALTGLVGARISPLVTDSTLFPFIVFTRTNVAPEYDKGGASQSAFVDVEIAAVSDNYGQAVAVAERCIEALDGVTAEYDGFAVDYAALDSALEGFAGDAYTQNLIFKFHITSN